MPGIMPEPTVSLIWVVAGIACCIILATSGKFSLIPPWSIADTILAASGEFFFYSTVVYIPCIILAASGKFSL